MEKFFNQESTPYKPVYVIPDQMNTKLVLNALRDFRISINNMLDTMIDDLDVLIGVTIDSSKGLFGSNGNQKKAFKSLYLYIRAILNDIIEIKEITDTKEIEIDTDEYETPTQRNNYGDMYKSLLKINLPMFDVKRIFKYIDKQTNTVKWDELKLDERLDVLNKINQSTINLLTDILGFMCLDSVCLSLNKLTPRFFKLEELNIKHRQFSVMDEENKKFSFWQNPFRRKEKV